MTLLVLEGAVTEQTFYKYDDISTKYMENFLQLYISLEKTAANKVHNLRINLCLSICQYRPCLFQTKKVRL